MPITCRDSEHDLVPVCRELGIGIVAYSPLGRGFLSGAITKPEDLPADDSRRNYPRYQGEAFVKVSAATTCALHIWQWQYLCACTLLKPAQQR
jgi:aryl-alcohol dehydrogenase-like predicted oxidoreductase